MLLANLKIGVRLGVGFGVVLTLLTAMMLLGLASMSRIGNRTQDILNDKNVKMAAVRGMVGDVRTITLALTTMTVVSTVDQMNTELAKVDEARKRYKESRDKLASMMTEEKEKALLAAVDDALKTGAEKNNKLIQMRKDGAAEEAVDYLLKETGPVQAKALAALNDVFTYETKMMDEAGADVQQVYGNARIMQLALGTIAMAMGVSVAWFITRSITVPLNRAVTVAETVASGDLSSRIETDGKDETARLLQALKKMNDALLGVVGQVRTGTDAITTASHEIAAGNMDLSSRTEQQASSLEETVSSMEQLTSTVRQNADNARQANTLAHSASEVASRGGAIVAQVVDTMGAINTSSSKIADIIGVIDGIAFQTNILALNAAVEAARAGEQGRGFAVVASEVRSLAQRSAAAAKEIKELIDASVTNVDAGSRLVNDAGQTMGDIVDSIQRVADIMGEITSASQEQTLGIEQINKAIAQMDQSTQQNAALVEEAAAASQSMQEQADKLARVVGFFSTGAHAMAAPTVSRAVALAPKAAPARAAAKPAARKTASKPAAPKSAAQPKQDEWEEF